MPEERRREEIPDIPPSPEIRVRTLESDAAALTRGGGSVFPREERVTIPVSSPAPPPSFKPKGTPPFLKRIVLGVANFLGSRFVVGLTFLVVLVILGFLGYFIVYPFLSETTPRPPDLAPRPPLPPSPPELPPPPATPAFVHQSYFRIPADATLPITINVGPAESAEDILSYSQKVEAAAASTTAKSDFFEIVVHDERKRPFEIPQFLSRIGAPLFEVKFLIDNFNPDFTAFVLRDGRGLWSGLVLRAKERAAPFTLESEVKKLEFSKDLVNLFFSPPGEPSRAGFRDKTVLGRAVRFLPFGPDSGGVSAEFSYSWFNNTTLVLSTSEKGLEEAFERLGR